MALKTRTLVYEEPFIAVNIGNYYEKDDEERRKFDNYLKSDEKNMRKAQLHHKDTAMDNFNTNLGILYFKVTGKDELMDAYELKTVMEMIFVKDYGGKDSFSLETCRCMVASIDKNRHGTLGYEQFKRLWSQIFHWKRVFEECDKNNDRKIDRMELELAVEKLGLELSRETLDVINSRYMNRIGNINLDDFYCVCAKIKTLKYSYKSLKKQDNFTFDKYLIECLYS